MHPYSFKQLKHRAYTHCMHMRSSEGKCCPPVSSCICNLRWGKWGVIPLLATKDVKATFAALSDGAPLIIVMDGEGKGKNDCPCLLITYLWTANSSATNVVIIPSLELATRAWATPTQSLAIHRRLPTPQKGSRVSSSNGYLLPSHVSVLTIFSPQFFRAEWGRGGFQERMA